MAVVTRLLGTVLAGGRSSRFGSDKALALWQGHTLLDWAITALSRHTHSVVICGREGGLADRPAGGLGPLAGLNAALHHGRDLGFDAVLSLPCDTPIVDHALLSRLCHADGAAYVRSLPVIGLWPTRFADLLDVHLRGPDRSLHSWARRIDALPIAFDAEIPNVNTLDDLDSLTMPID